MQFLYTKQTDEKLTYWSLQFIMAIVFGISILIIICIIYAFNADSYFTTILYSIAAFILVLIIILFFNPNKTQFEEIEFNKKTKKIDINLRNRKQIFSTQQFDVSQITDFKIVGLAVMSKSDDGTERKQYWLLSLKINGTEYNLGQSPQLDSAILNAQRITDYTGLEVEVPK